jgi:hypothetical protein
MSALTPGEQQIVRFLPDIEILPVVSVLRQAAADCPEVVMGGKPRTQHIFSGFPRITDLRWSIAIHQERMNRLSFRRRTNPHRLGATASGRA